MKIELSYRVILTVLVDLDYESIESVIVHDNQVASEPHDAHRIATDGSWCMETIPADASDVVRAIDIADDAQMWPAWEIRE